jgi:catechol 2,3-dioxygenase-like lactoylglutathione lyase family enzyme
VIMYRRNRNGGIDASAGPTLAAARALYCDVLGGRQMRRMKADDGSMLSFLVGADLVTTGPGAADDHITLVVDDALAIAERCWDAGFEVRVRGPADAGTIVVIDPFDLELEVISSGSLANDCAHCQPQRGVTW